MAGSAPPACVGRCRPLRCGRGAVRRRRGRREWVASARRAIYCMAAVFVTAFAILESAYLRSDFSFQLVAQDSSTDTPTFYKLTAIWSSQDGSLLLWATLLGCSRAPCSSSRAAHCATSRPARTRYSARGRVLPGHNGGPGQPVRLDPGSAQEGNGLNPLLRHPAMMFHPPMLYSG